MQIWFEKDSPFTCAILGALVSGGDVLKLAKILVGREQEKDENTLLVKQILP